MDFEWKQRVIFAFIVALPAALLIEGSVVIPSKSASSLKGLPPCPISPESQIIPDSFDGRYVWKNCPSLWEVRDQGSCSSWATAIASVVSDRLCVQSKGILQVRVSEQDIISCAMQDVEDEVGGGCNAANIPEVWNYLVKKGSVSGGSYLSQSGCKPYQIETCDHKDTTSCSHSNIDLTCIRECSNPLFLKEYDEDIVQLESACQLPANDNAAIQAEILSNGPVLAVLNLYDDLYSYNYSLNDGIYTNYKKHVDAIGNHPVKIVGWGWSNVNGSGRMDYWIVANSWNYQWGYGGFFRVTRSDTLPRLGAYITRYVTAPTPSLKSLTPPVFSAIKHFLKVIGIH